MKVFRDKKIHMVIARSILYMTAGLIIVVVGAFLSLQTSPVREAVMRIIEDAIAQHTRVVCRIEKLSGNLLSRFEISGIELEDAKTGVSLMSADSIAVSYSIPMLLGRVLWINRLSIDGADVNLIQAADGAWNFEMLAPGHPSELPTENGEAVLPEPSPPAAYKVAIRRLGIRSSEVTITQQSDTDETIRRFTGIECKARLDIARDITAKVSQLSVLADNPQLDIRELSGGIRFDFDESLLGFDDIRIVGEKSDFTINGRLEFAARSPNPIQPAQFTMDLQAAIKRLSLGEFGRVFPIQMPDSDIVSGDIAVKGPLAEMDCRVDLHMDECHVVSQGLVTLDEFYNVGLDIAGNIRRLDLSVLPVLELQAFPGSINTGFSLFWQQIGMPDQAGRITLDLDASRMWGYLTNNGKLDVRIAGADFVFDKILFNTPYGKLTGSGSLDEIMASENDNRIQFIADISGLNPEQLIKNSQYAGDINATIQSSIFIPKTFVLKDVNVDTTCRLFPSRMSGLNIFSANLDASWQDETISIKQWAIETEIGTADLTGTASVNDKTCRFKAAAVLADLEPVRRFIPQIKNDETLAGNVSMQADIAGSWENPDISAVASVNSIVFREVSADSFSAEGDWHGGLKEFRMAGKCSAENIRVNGLQLASADLETAMTQETVSMDINIIGGQKEEFSLSGTISHWMEPDKEISINKMVFVSPDQPPLVNREPMKLSISPDRIIVKPLYLDSGNASLALRGEAAMMPPANVSADLTLEDFNLQRIAGFWKGGEKIQGHMSADIQVTGVMEDPFIRMQVSVAEASYEGLPKTDLSMALNYENSQVQLTGTGVRQGNRFLKINGSAAADLAFYPFKFTPRPESLMLAVNLEQVDLSEISGLLTDSGQVHGRLSSEMTLSGMLDSPDIDVKARINDGKFDEFVVSEISALINYSDSKARITASAIRKDKKLLDVNGSALFDLSIYPFEFTPKPSGLNLKMDADRVDISWISDIINDPEYDIRGFIDATASAKGDFYKPRIKGRVQLQDGSLHLKKQQLIYETLNADLRFGRKTITIVELNLKGDKEGSLNLSGVVTHNNFKPEEFNLRAIGNQLYIPFHSGVDARINPDLKLAGTWEAPVLSGEIKVPEGRVSLEQFIEKQLSEIEIVEPIRAENGVLQIPEKEPEPLEFVDPLTADINVIIPNDFWFRGTDEFIEIKGNIQLKKSPKKPFVLYGSVFPVRGTYRFRGKLFQIKQGELMFTGQEDINPSVNIEAVNIIDDVKIIIRLTGTFEYLNLNLDSDPAMDQAEIISYLIFGRAPDDLSEKESFQAGEAALSFTGQIAADKLRDIVGDTLGIDYLNISAGSGGLRQGSLTMGKYVLPKVFVTFRQGFDETVTQKLEVTYEINKNFDLETQVDSEQTSALDLIWKYEF